ncbi:metallophosphoesterase [Motilimonas cestriensis]|uniref:metallophosphoesterase n=1 Tax=Motilimonas cestriensis TaxID=2742685 RepID=UPI003DA34C78
MKTIILSMALITGAGWASASSAQQHYQAGDKVTYNGDTYQCKPWPSDGWCNLASYQPGVGEFWPKAWDLLNKQGLPKAFINTSIHPEFDLGQTKPQTDQIYFYLGQCWQAKNAPGKWETPREGWFWQAASCQPKVPPKAYPMMAVARDGKHYIWRDNNTLLTVDYQFSEVSINKQALSESAYQGLGQYIDQLSGAFNLDANTLGVFLSNDLYLEYSIAEQAILPGYPIPMSERFEGMQTGVVGVMRWRNSDRIYAFYNDGSYDRITLSSGKVDNGYPKAVAGHWPGLENYGTEIIGISTVLPDFADVFLTDNRVARYDLAADRVVAGYPKHLPASLIDAPYNNPLEIRAGVDATGWITAAGNTGYNEWQDPRAAEQAAKLTAAFALNNASNAWFLNDGQYVEVDPATGNVLPGFPVDRDEVWQGIAADRTIVGALKWNDQRAFLFLDDGSYLRMNLTTKSVDSGYPKAINDSTWPGLGKYANNISAVLNHGYDYADIILTDQTIVRYSISADKLISEPAPMACYSDYLGLDKNATCELNFISAPYLQAPGPDRMTVMFEMQAKGGVVEYWQQGEQAQQVAASVSKEDPMALVQEATLTNLAPNTTYQYRVMVGKQASETYQFRTYPASSAQQAQAKFIAISDVQRGNENVLTEIVNGIIKHECDGQVVKCSQTLAGIIMAGDITETGGDRSNWRKDLMARMKAIAPYVPMIPVTGNHDYHSDAELTNYRSYFAPPQNGSSEYPEHWYTLDYLGLRIIGLDSYPVSGINGRFNRNTLETQRNWLTDTLAQSNDKSFVMAAFHHPCLSEMWLKGESIGMCEAVRMLEDFSAETGITSGHVYGHTHSYSRGQSRDVPHLWLNAASVSGTLEPLNDQSYIEREVFDYDTIAVSNNHYGYSTLEFDFNANTMVTKRRDFDRTAQTFPQTDQAQFAPEGVVAAPIPAAPSVQTLSDLALAVTGVDNAYELHWQVSKQADFSGLVFDLWGNDTRVENWQYQRDVKKIAGSRPIGHQPENLQKGADISKLPLAQLLAQRGRAIGGDDQFYWRKLYTGQATHSSKLNEYDNQYRPSLSVEPGETLYWRARSRSSNMVWSDWSDTAPVAVTGSISDNLLDDNQWQVTQGVMQRINVPTSSQFAPASNSKVWAGKGHGGATTNGNQDWMQQSLAVTGGEKLLLSVAMTTWENRDKPAVKALVRTGDGKLTELARLTTRYARVWDYRQQVLQLPNDAVEVIIVVGGQGNAGNDNDIYFDQLALKRML